MISETHRYVIVNSSCVLSQVIRSLKRALQPAITDVSVLFKVPKECEVLQCPHNLPPIFNGEKLVVYAIVKSKAKLKKMECTAILKGNLLGKWEEHKVPFTLSSTAEVPSLPVIHHLAAKALISDWESEGKEKKSIVDLSIESSVISSHTAFIAVDEESSEPLSGAMKAYDIRAQTHTQQAVYLVSKGARLRGASAPRKKKKGKALFSRSAQAVPMSMPVMESSRSRREDISAALLARRGGDSPPSPSSFDDEVLGLPPPGYGAPPLPTLNFSGAPPPPPHDSFSLSGHKSLPSYPTKNPIDNLTNLIAAQQVNGSWVLNSSLAQMIGKSLTDLESGCPVERKGNVDTVWATVLAVSVLRAQYSSQQDEWELIAMKAELWLKKQSLPSGCTLEQLFQAAAKITQ